jgi:hypothetical protein
MIKLAGINMKHILRCISMPAFLLLSAVSVVKAQDSLSVPAQSPIEGRWDITVDVDGRKSPSWFEVRHSGYHTFVGQFVGISGSARPISRVNFKDGKFSFSIPPQWEKQDKDLSVEGTVDGDNLSGTMSFSDGNTHTWTGRRAPALRAGSQPAWGKPIRLFDGKNLDEWHAMGESQWKVEDGIMRSPKSGANFVTNKTFKDFKLHIEFRYPKGSNSGVYLRGRYEVQVIDSKGLEPLKDLMGGVYGFVAPSEMVAKDPGEWQSYDITLVGRMITLVGNGKTIICNQEIPGITGGALDSNEGEPGPILLQGDHGAIDYRNITITPAVGN